MPFAPPPSVDPLEIRHARALSLPFGRMAPRASGLAAGRSEFGIGLHFANELRLAGAVREDAETDRLLLDYRRGVGGGWTVGGSVALVSRGGGWMDGPIDFWHGLIGSTGTPRDGVPYGRSFVTGPGYSFGSATGLSDLDLRAVREFAGGWSAGGSVKLPTGRAAGLLGSGAVDGTVDVAKRWRSGRFRFLAQAGLTFQGRATRLPGARATVPQVLLMAAWAPNSRDAYLLQIQSETSAIRTGVGASDGTHRIGSLGYRRRVGAEKWVEVHFSEDDDIGFLRGSGLLGSGPDFAWGARYVVRF